MDMHAQHYDDMFTTNQIERMSELTELLRQLDGAEQGRENGTKDGDIETERRGKRRAREDGATYGAASEEVQAAGGEKKKDVTADGKVKRADGETHITTHQSLKRFTKETALMVNICVADSESIFE